MKNELLKELIIVLFSIDYLNTGHIREKFKWQEKDLELEFSTAGEDNHYYFCGRHFIRGFNEPDIESFGMSGIEYRVTFTITFNDLDSLFEDVLNVIDNNELKSYAFENEYYSRATIDLFKVRIKDMLMDAIYGDSILDKESEVIKLLLKTTEFSHKGVDSLIQYSNDRKGK